jgi:hypothetical protein
MLPKQYYVGYVPRGDHHTTFNSKNEALQVFQENN